MMSGGWGHQWRVSRQLVGMDFRQAIFQIMRVDARHFLESQVEFLAIADASFS
jgi:hypothetical protein